MFSRINYFNNFLRLVVLLFCCFVGTTKLYAAMSEPVVSDKKYGLPELIESGNKFFGTTTGNLASVFEKIFSAYGAPNSYILGQEASGAFIGGLTYGEGVVHSKNGSTSKAFWQGPTVGWDFGGQGSRLMILIYNLNNIDSLWRRYAGLSGSAYFVAGAGFNIMRSGDIMLIPVRTGVGARLGVSFGYLKLTPTPTWNPF